MIKDSRKANLFQKIKYQPIPKAEAVHNSEKQVVVVQAPSRSAKSSTCVPEAVFKFLHEKTNTWIVGIDYSSTDRFIFGSANVKGIESFCREFFPWVIDFKTGKNKKDHLLRNKLNSVIKGKSVKYPESFVAEPVDLIICEDAGSYPESFFDIHIRPRVLDTGGRIFLNSVPPITKTNWLVHLSRNDTVDSFSWSLYDNVYLKKEEIENFIRDCPPHLHRAFVDGLPPEEDSSVFGKIRDNVMGGFFEYTPGHVYQGGVDIGRTFDRTVLSISDLTLGRLAYIDVFPPKFFRTELVEERLLNSLKRYEFPNTYVDVSGIGSAFQAMIDSHHFFLPFTIPNLKTRNALIEELAIAFQRNYTIPEIPYLINELENLEIILKQNYHLYRSRHGFHDDTIIATALSIYGWSRKMNPVDFRSIEPVEIKATVIEDNRFQITPIDPVSLVGEEYLL